MRDLLAPGGLVWLAIPDAGSRVARVLGRRWWSVLPTHVQYFTRDSIAVLLERCGFEVLDVATAPKAFTVRYYLERIARVFAAAVAPADPGRRRRRRRRPDLGSGLPRPDFRDRPPRPLGSGPPAVGQPRAEAGRLPERLEREPDQLPRDRREPGPGPARPVGGGPAPHAVADVHLEQRDAQAGGQDRQVQVGNQAVVAERLEQVLQQRRLVAAEGAVRVAGRERRTSTRRSPSRASS